MEDEGQLESSVQPIKREAVVLALAIGRVALSLALCRNGKTDAKHSPGAWGRSPHLRWNRKACQ
jgi:hypothetical protein